MLQLMTWSEIIENLKLEGKLKMAAIYDLSGNKIAETDGAVMTSGEAATVLKCLDTITTTIYGLFLMGSKFSCINVDKNTLIGQCDGDIVVAHRNQNLLICAVSGLHPGTSCLATVKNFLGRLIAEGTPDVTVPSLM